MTSHQCKKKPFRPASPSFPLALAGEGEQVQIAAIQGGGNLLERLLGMGIKPRDIVEVVQRRGQGIVLIAKETDRYALGGGMAHKIYVTKV
ncbi:MAG: FeoA family protein [Deltaproteobacteria bacterium]|jgi:ferrous iron transport protein A|nr:FeoA family protein [Deltaproteobacteria bacterium]